TMPELPRLDDLVWLTNLARYHTDRVLQSDTGNRRGEEEPHEVQRLRLCLTAGLPVEHSRPWVLRGFVEPPRTRARQVGAWGMSDHEVPTIVQNVPHVSLI